MSTQIFINLPVRDLEKSKAFFAALGHSTNPQFTDENAACVVISDTIYVMLLVEPFFQGFTRKAICTASSDGRRRKSRVMRGVSKPATGVPSSRSTW